MARRRNPPEPGECVVRMDERDLVLVRRSDLERCARALEAACVMLDAQDRAEAVRHGTHVTAVESPLAGELASCSFIFYQQLGHQHISAWAAPVEPDPEPALIEPFPSKVKRERR